VNGKTGRCRHFILHPPYRDIAHHIAVVNQDSTVRAGELFERGVKVTTPGIFLRSAGAFLSSYIYRKGFLDGYAGFVISLLTGYHTFLAYSKLLEHHEYHGKEGGSRFSRIFH
jgi:hypothetical protein